MGKLINKTMDREDLRRSECLNIVEELNSLMKLMQSKNLRYSSWYGRLELPYYDWFEKMNRGKYEPWELNCDDKNIPWFLLWEIAWVISNIELEKGSTLLDMGGASSLFSCYLAYKGHTVYSVDLNDLLVKNGNDVAEKMGWDMRCINMDMRNLKLDDHYFDHIFSICVFEHIPISSRISINSKIASLLKRGGMFCLTFDYMNPVKLADISSPEDIKRQFVVPSGLEVYGNKEFFDDGKRYLESPYYLPSFGRAISIASRIVNVLEGNISLKKALSSKNTDYTFGSLFLRKA